MFRDQTECCHAIGTALARAAREPWDRIVLDADLDDERVDAVVACWRGGEDRPCGYLAGVPRLANHVYDLARLTSTPKKGLFRSCAFVLKKDGTYKVDFTY